LAVENQSIEIKDWDMIVQPKRGWWDLHLSEFFGEVSSHDFSGFKDI
jgi:hypothetical protein